MQFSLSFIRGAFILLCTLGGSLGMVPLSLEYFSWAQPLVGAGIGLGIGLSLLLIERILQKLSLKNLNTLIIGLFVGYFFSQAVLLVISAVIPVTYHIPFLFVGIVLACTYVGMVVTAKAANEFNINIPFLRFKPEKNSKKDILADASALADARIIDLASSGILDHHLVIPRHIVKELHAQAESDDDPEKNRARRCLEVLRKLEAIPSLGLRYTDTSFPEIKDPMTRLIRIARFQEANILTADINRVQQAVIEGVQIINIHALSNALKPLMQAGESMTIKIQRYGKEPRQGVGYLEDGTMVVVNDGAKYFGKNIKTQVLSVKHTSSGRMIFCNASEEGDEELQNYKTAPYSSSPNKDLSPV